MIAGFDEFVATPQCAPSATTNCGCFWEPGKPPTNDSQCLVGHYNGTCATCNDHLECGQYFKGAFSGVRSTVLALPMPTIRGCICGGEEQPRAISETPE